MTRETAIVLATKRELQRQADRHEHQEALFKRIGVYPSAMVHSKFVLNKKAEDAIAAGKPIDPYDLSNYTLVKRDSELDPEFHDSGARSAAGSTKSWASKNYGMNTMTSDETVLFLTGQDICSVEVGEAASAGMSVD